VNKRERKIYTECKLSEFITKKASRISGFKIAITVFHDCLCLYRNFIAKANIQVKTDSNLEVV